MTDDALKFVNASAYEGDVHHLPVTSADEAARWYATHFAMTEIERSEAPVRNIVLERDGVRFGVSENGGDSSQNGAAIRVVGIDGVRDELAGRGVNVSDCRTDERDGETLRVFFVVAPDGLCFYFHEPIE